MIMNIKSFFVSGGISLFAAAGLMTLTGLWTFWGFFLIEFLKKREKLGLFVITVKMLRVKIAFL